MPGYSVISGSVRHKIPVGGSGFDGTYRDAAFNGYEYGKPAASAAMFHTLDSDIKRHRSHVYEPNNAGMKTSGKNRVDEQIEFHRVKESKKSTLTRLLESASAPDLSNVQLEYDWQKRFSTKDFLIPPNNTGYRPLWTYDQGFPSRDLRSMDPGVRYYPKLEAKRGEDPHWMGPTVKKLAETKYAGRPLSPASRTAAARSVMVNLPPL